MRAKNSFSVNFFLKKSKASGGTAPLYARITVNSADADLSLKRRVIIKDWDQKAQRLGGNGFEAIEIREKMRRKSVDINVAYDDLRREKQVVTPELVKLRVEGEDQQQEDVTLLGLIEYHNTEISKLLEEGTMKNYRSTEKFVKEYLHKWQKIPDVYVTQVNYKFLLDFEIFLRNRKPDKGQRKCSNNTVIKHFQRLHKIMGIALKSEWIEKDPFIGTKLKIIHSDRECLEWEEIEALRKLELDKPGLVIVRDIFLFCCNTGLAFGDFSRLRHTDITTDNMGDQWIEMFRKKTKNFTQRNFFVLLLPEALELIDKYRDHPKAINKGTLFPCFCNQTINKYLKVLAKLAGINKRLSSHVARHTFATTVTLENLVSIESISKMLGHGSIRTTQIYSKVKKKMVGNDMRNLRDKLKKQIVVERAS